MLPQKNIKSLHNCDPESAQKSQEKKTGQEISFCKSHLRFGCSSDIFGRLKQISALHQKTFSSHHPRKKGKISNHAIHPHIFGAIKKLG